MPTKDAPTAARPKIVTRADILGTERRTRRGHAPVAAGGSLLPDGTPDYGLFGPGSVVWEVMLHPAVIVFHHAGQQQSQATYKPIEAGIRDWEPLSRKARDGSLTMFDVFERASRGAGMHLPMWLGDTPTAEHMAKWLHSIHTRVVGDVIDHGDVALGGYDAAGPRESLWAALTELHPMLRMFEAFAFRDGRRPHRLPDHLRDRYIAEAAAYCRLHGADEDEIPTNIAELGALYERYAPLFQHSATVAVMPEYGKPYTEVMQAVIKQNFHPSHLRATWPTMLLIVAVRHAVSGAMPAAHRRAMGMTPAEAKKAVRATRRALPLAWLLTRRPIERRIMRIMWGADGVTLIEHARRLHADAMAAQGGVPR